MDQEMKDSVEQCRKTMEKIVSQLHDNYFMQNTLQARMENRAEWELAVKALVALTRVLI